MPRRPLIGAPVVLVSLSWTCAEGHPRWRPSRQELARTARQERARARAPAISTPPAGGHLASTDEITRGGGSGTSRFSPPSGANGVDLPPPPSPVAAPLEVPTPRSFSPRSSVIFIALVP